MATLIFRLTAEDFEEEFPGAPALATECHANIIRTGDLLVTLHNAQAWEDFGLSDAAMTESGTYDGQKLDAPSVIRHFFPQHHR